MTSCVLAGPVLRRADGAPHTPCLRFEEHTWLGRDLAAAIERAAAQLPAASDPLRLAAMLRNDGPSLAVLLAAERAGHLLLLLSPTLRPNEVEAAMAAAGAGFIWREGTWYRYGPERSWSGPPAIAQLTSGSLGPARPAVRSVAGIAEEVTAVSERLRFRPGLRVLTASAISHSYALIGGLLAPLVAGSEVMLATPDATAAMAATGPELLFGLGGTYECLLAASVPLPSLRLALSAGAPLPSDLAARFRAAYGLTINQDYGTTETGTIAIDADSQDDSSVGHPLAHLAVRLQPPPDIPLPSGATGEIQVRGPAVALGYLDTGTIAPAADKEGWYRTGDAGSVLDGKLRLHGRLRPALSLVDGEIRPETIETQVRRLPGVTEAVAISASGPNGEPGIKVIVTGPCADASAIRRVLTAVPPESLLVEVVERLPVSPAGKLLHKYLR